MIINKDTSLQFKGSMGRWQNVIAREDFDTNDEHWKLTINDRLTGKQADFNPVGKLCKLRILIENKPKLIYNQGDIKSNKDEIEKVNKIVLDLMTNDVRCRNDDKWLTFKVMSNFTKIYIPFEDFDKMPAFETIKRVRAKIQNTDKQLLPTDPLVAIKRKVREEDFKQYFGKSKSEFK